LEYDVSMNEQQKCDNKSVLFEMIEKKEMGKLVKYLQP